MSAELLKADHAKYDEALKERAKALFHAGNTPEEIADICLVPLRTVQLWKQGWDTFEDVSARARELVRIIQDGAPERIRALIDVQKRMEGIMLANAPVQALRQLCSAYKDVVEIQMTICRMGGALAPVQEKGSLNVEVTNVAGRTDIEASQTQARIHMMEAAELAPPSTAAEKVQQKLAMIEDQKRQQAVLKEMEGPAPFAPIDIERERNHGKATDG